MAHFPWTDVATLKNIFELTKSHCNYFKTILQRHLNIQKYESGTKQNIKLDLNQTKKLQLTSLFKIQVI